MSDTEEDNFELIGTLLEPLDEDTIPKKKAFSIEDQVATDEQGRRRFHGAFTGGFSAGFFNTVGSLEGWKPSEFKSSRSEKADKRLQKPEDFMDAEDQGVYGIAPKLLRATSDYSNISRRKRVMNDGPIPGEPVLFSVLQPAKETVGIRLLKRMGWKPGQGVGPRLTKSQKLKARREHQKNQGKVYGCEIPEQFRRQVTSESESEEEFEVTFAPDDYDAFIYKPKDNTFGMGYTGLDKRNILGGHITLFDQPKFRMQDRNNKKLSISGQAFGVGAFENEDEDIYSKDDMSRYDFELEAFSRKKKLKECKQEKPLIDIIEGFVLANIKASSKKSYPAPVLPKGFTAKHGARISRFEPLPEDHKFHNYDRSKVTGRHDLTASDRSKIINSTNTIIPVKTQEIPVTQEKKIAGISFTTSKPEKKSFICSKSKISFVSSKPILENEEENKRIQEQAKKITEGLTKTPTGSFQPFITNPDKQKRYEIYLTLKKHNQIEKLREIQPISMTDWEKNIEENEFEQAARLFKPTFGLVFDRFVSASSSTDDLDPLKPVSKSIHEHGTPEMREAAKRKMFGPLTRVVLPWKPHKLLCKRFNVPEPNMSDDAPMTSKRKSKFSIFDYYEAYQQNKTQDGPLPREENKEDTEKEKTKISQNKEICEEKMDVENESIKSIQLISDSNKNSDIQNQPSCSFTSNDQKEIVFTDTFRKNNKSVQNSNILNDNNVPSSSKFSESEPKNVSQDNLHKIATVTSKHSLEINVNNLNKKIEVTESLTVPSDPQAKKDLFKAIFLSSDESESEKEDEEQNKEEEKLTEMKKIVLEDTIKPANLPEQNTSEKSNRPVAKGFFADLDLSKLKKSTETSVEEVTNKAKQKTDNKTDVFGNFYGPKLPINNAGPQRIIFSKKTDRTTKTKDIVDDGQWVEADIKKNKKDKSHKKHKKHKDKDKPKKHKSKHKKSKYSDSD